MNEFRMSARRRMHVAVVGAGAAGLAAAWLLAKKHDVTLVEKNDRLGGHAHTAFPTGGQPPVDTGFIVYNEPNYPNLTAWLHHLGVATEPSDMSFAVSRNNGGFEYAGGPAFGMFAQPSLALRPRFWRMLKDLLRFYREAPQQITPESTQTLGQFLRERAYSDAFLYDHLLPFGAAIWSTPPGRMLDYPAGAFVRFCNNHGLLNVGKRPQWRTVSGGSATYVARVREDIGEKNIRTDLRIDQIERTAQGVVLTGYDGSRLQADQVVIATHADQALAMLNSPDQIESDLLGCFEYEQNLAILHTDIRFLPKRRRAWCSWNYVEHDQTDPERVSVSYWMNRLQNLGVEKNYIVTLNPAFPPEQNTILRSCVYEHPRYTSATWRAQQQLWDLQGHRGCWYCGSYFGAGFHEDAIQAGFAVAEQLGSVARPWRLPDPSNRIVLSDHRLSDRAAA